MKKKKSCPVCAHKISRMSPNFAIRDVISIMNKETMGEVIDHKHYHNGECNCTPIEVELTSNKKKVSENKKKVSQSKRKAPPSYWSYWLDKDDSIKSFQSY